MANSSRKIARDLLPPLVIIFGLGIAYALSLAPGLSWANNGADGGDLITAAATGGVAHPTGYPTYLAIARLFQFLPIGSIAFRTNLLSLFFAILTALLIYATILNFTGLAQRNWKAGLIAAFAFGLSPLAWSQAVITEVYTLQTFFIILLLLLLIVGNHLLPNHPVILNLVIGLVFGLAMGNHLTTLFLLPLVVLVDVIKFPANPESPIPGQSERRNQVIVDWKTLFTRCIGILFGLMIFGSLYFRARSGSPINWGNPVTWSNLLWVVTGKLYQSDLFALSNGFFMIKLRVWAKLILHQSGWIGLLLGTLGIIVVIIRKMERKIIWGTVYLIVAFSVFSFIYATDDSFIYLLFSEVIYSLWIGMGAAYLIDKSSLANPWMGNILGLVLLVYLVWQGSTTFLEVDASKDLRAEEFGERVMLTVPRQAMIFTDGDKDSFTLWYYQYVLQERKDIAIIVTNLLPYDWYRSSLAATYPDLSLPASTTGSWETEVMAFNKNRPVCETIVVNQGQLNCQQQ